MAGAAEPVDAEEAALLDEQRRFLARASGLCSDLWRMRMMT